MNRTKTTKHATISCSGQTRVVTCFFEKKIRNLLVCLRVSENCSQKDLLHIKVRVLELIISELITIASSYIHHRHRCVYTIGGMSDQQHTPPPPPQPPPHYYCFFFHIHHRHRYVYTIGGMSDQQLTPPPSQHYYCFFFHIYHRHRYVYTIGGMSDQ